MSTLRKLQVEIEKTLKRVQEGLSIFDDILEQVRTFRYDLKFGILWPSGTRTYGMLIFFYSFII